MNDLNLQVALEEISKLAAKLKEERDEARNDLEFRRELYRAQTSRLKLARRERDEAREALMKIEDVFVDGDDAYEDWRTMGIIARAALEGQK